MTEYAYDFYEDHYKTMFEIIKSKYDPAIDTGNEDWYRGHLNTEIITIAGVLSNNFNTMYKDELKNIATDENVVLRNMNEKLINEVEELKKKLAELTPAPTPRLVPVIPIENKGIGYRCECGAFLAHKDATYVKRHKLTKKHLDYEKNKE
jgi:hypothetical protein